MSTSGKSAWQKYYFNKGDVTTKLKKDSNIYDALSGKITDEYAVKGAEVIVQSTEEYDSKPIVLLEGSPVRVLFDAIQKPGRRPAWETSLKPQAFGIKDHPYTIDEYFGLVLKSIKSRDTLSTELKQYLVGLFEMYSTEQPSTNLIEIYAQHKNHVPVEDVNKDFGEVLGPAACYTNQLLAPKQIDLSANTRIFVPTKSNEPLLDFSLIDDSKKYIMSAKSGKSTNVVKSANILDLLHQNTNIVEKWFYSKQYKILKLLHENSALIGPIAALNELDAKLMPEKSLRNISEGDYTKKDLKALMEQNEYLRELDRLPNLMEIGYAAERVLKYESRHASLNMNSLFADAIQGKVWYIKFEIKKNGLGDFRIVDAEDIRSSEADRIYFRSKNGYTRRTDKCGLQI